MLKVIPPLEDARILVHSCCAPCSGAILECLVENGFRPAVFFSNSNIYPREEYNLRLREIRRYAEKMGLEIIDDVYDHAAWAECVRGHENDPERGPRCLKCFRFRLDRAVAWAGANGFNVLTTTLASSRWKSLEQVDEAGRAACEGSGVVWWSMNWRKGGLQQRRGEIIREQQFYNQTYCGCEFSKNGYICSR
ncbi:MAG: epoxyqueuosine reductase QueH [Bacteroidales bacterium]|nr:epoxyqueuosine reductase QueH [Bacteroidales bacterium]